MSHAKNLHVTFPINKLFESASLSSDSNNVNFGVNRLDIFANFNFKDLDLLKQKLKNSFNHEFPFKYDQYTGVLSIAHHKQIDDEQLLKFTVEFLDKNSIEFRKIYNFNTNIYYEDYLKTGFLQNNNLSLEDTSIYDNRYYHSNWAKENINENLFSSVGLDKETRTRHFNSFINNKLSIGVLETGVVESHFPTFEWNRKYGNGIWWRNEWFFEEKHTRHSTQVSELIAGKNGIMPTLGIVSVQVAVNWNGISGEMNFLLRHTNIVNNSWAHGYIRKTKQADPQMVKYNWLSKYLDDLIFNNKELINVVAAGNLNGEGVDTLFSNGLSRNSIVVGATDIDNLERKTYYSQIGNNLNYVSVVAPGGKYWFSDLTQIVIDGKKIDLGYDNEGTSFSAPVISTIAGMLKQKYKSYFDQGSDSIIFKSALITGSRKPQGINSIYTNETGYGIPNYQKIEQAIQSLIILPKTDKSNNSWNNSRQVYLSKGDKIRASLAFLYNGSNDKTNIDFRIKDINGNIIASSNSWNKNIEVVEFTVPSTGFYWFEAYRSSSNTNPVEVAITYTKAQN